MATAALRRPTAGPRDREAGIRSRYESFVESLSAEEGSPSKEPFSLASLKSIQNGSSMSAEVDFAEIVADIVLIKNEVAKYEGRESPLFRKIINEACLQLKMKLDNTKFDCREDRKQKITEINEIKDNLFSEVHK